MTTVVPSAPPGPRAVPSSGDGAHVRRNPDDGDFAAALSETASDVADEAVGEEPAGQTREVRRPQTKAVHRLDTRARHAAAGGGDRLDAEIRTEMLGEKSDGRAAGVRDITLPLVAERALSQEIAQPAAAGVQVPTEVAQIPQPTPQRGDAARDALAVLGADMMAKRDAAAPSVEVITQSRRQAPVAARSTDTVSGEPEKSDSPGSPGDAPDIRAIPIRVLRQETHFQPIAHEARRLLGITAGAADERALPLSLAAAARINRPQALQQLAKDAPATSDGAAAAAEPLSPALALSPIAADGAAPVSVGQQIADGVQRALASSTEPTAPRSVPGADPAASVFAPTLRTIKLQLNPHSLGMVTVVLTGGDGDLRIHLEAERAETFGKVEQERGVLSSRLNSAGYGITEVTVGRSATADTQNRDGDQREAAARQGAQSGSPQGDTAGGNARQSAEQFADQRARREAGEHALRTPGAPAAPIAKGAANSAPVAGLSYAGRFRPV